MLGNVVVGAFSVDTLAVIECMYCVHDSRVDLSGCPCFSRSVRSGTFLTALPSVVLSTIFSSPPDFRAIEPKE